MRLLFPNCTETREGVSAYASEDNLYYVCTEQKWHAVNQVVESTDDLSNCTEKREGQTVYVDGVAYVCQNEKWTKTELDSVKTSASSGSDKSSGCKNSSSASKSNSSDSKSGSSDSKEASSSSCGIPENPGTFEDARDGSVYKTVVVGTRLWMAENLRYAVTAPYPAWWMESRDEGDDLLATRYPNGDEANVEKYGLLYPRSVAEVACPASWHEANSADREELYTEADPFHLGSF